MPAHEKKENKPTGESLVQASTSARWVELPDCTSGQALGADDIPLTDDLSNAGIATCKSYTPPSINTNPANPNNGLTNSQLDSLTGQGRGSAPRGNYPGIDYQHYTPPSIYDPVWKTATSIKETEHQVVGFQEG